jgi:hypothetical protein
LTEIFREIDEELRYEKLQRLWRRYRVVIIALVAGLILGTAGYVGWKDYAEKQAQERARAFAAALDAAAQPDDAAALAALDAVAAGSDGYAALARLQKAAVELRSGNTAGAVAVYESLAADTSVEATFRDLAVVLLAVNSLDTGEPDELIARLAPLTADGNAWHHSARELTALLMLRKGDTAGARDLLTALSADVAAPAGLRQRAEELLAGLEG